MRRSMLALVSACLLTGALPAASVRAQAIETRPAGPCSFTATDLTFTSFDGTAIDATYYVPQTATPAHPEPAILTSHGFGGWHRGAGDVADHRMLASHCYVVLGFTERGFGNSGGMIELLSTEHEVRDARLLVDWLASRPEVRRDRRGDPRLGMFGGSYGGGIQTLLASHDHRVDAIIPQITWNDLRFSLLTNGVGKQSWTNLLFASGTVSGYCGADYASAQCNLKPPGWDPVIVEAWLKGTAAGGDPDGSISALLASRSPATYANRLRVPSLFVQGTCDTLFTMSEAVRNYQAVRANGAPAALLFFSGGHGCADDPTERRHINDRALAWLARYVRGNRSVAAGPGFETITDWLPGATNADRYLRAPGWPVQTAPQAYTLSSDGSLGKKSTASSGSVPVASLVLPTSYSELSNFESTSPLEATDVAEPLTAASFATAPLAAGLTVIGAPRLTFTLTSTAPEAILFWKIYDEAPDGTRSLVHRMVTPVRLRGDGPLTTPVPVTLTLQTMVHRFAAGHRLVLTAATSDTVYYPSRIPAVYGIGVGPGATLTLPADR